MRLSLSLSLSLSLPFFLSLPYFSLSPTFSLSLSLSSLLSPSLLLILNVSPVFSPSVFHFLSIFPPSSHLSSPLLSPSQGPDGVFSLLIGHTISSIVDRYSDHSTRTIYASCLAFLIGFVMFVFGVVRVGFLDNLISRPIISGFINGCALLLFVGQLGA